MAAITSLHRTPNLYKAIALSPDLVCIVLLLKYFLYSGDEEEVDTITAFNDTICAVSEWEDWSECSSTCGEGVKVRTRHFLHRMGRKKCTHVVDRETVKCMEPPCSQPVEVVTIIIIYSSFP